MLSLVYSVFMAAWRRAFGSDGWGLPILKNRFVLHVIAFLMTCGMCWYKNFGLYGALWVALWIQIEWALGHGPCYDLGRSGKPDAKMIKRYEKMVGYKLVCKLFPEDQWYSFGFDFILLSIRYTYPLLPICLWFNPIFLTLGMVITALYAMYRYCDYFRRYKIWDVEIWAGFFLGLYVSCL